MRTFGATPSNVEAVRRLAAYVVILDHAGRVAVVRDEASGRLFLPGGGSRPGESPRQTVEREVREELGHDVKSLAPLGEAIQHFRADGVHYRMHATFFAGRLSASEPLEPEHVWTFLPPDEALAEYFHASHAWIVEEAMRRSSQG
jgi:8-oxo-dGTP diphosphatase